MVDGKLNVLEQHMQELSVARKEGNRQGEGLACLNLGRYYQGTADFNQAITNSREALAIFKEVGFRSGEGSAYENLGIAYRSLGNFEQAIDYHNQCLIIAKEMRDRAKEGRAYGNLGNAYRSLGNFEQAVEYHNQCLITAKEVGDRAEEGGAYGNLGSAYHLLGNFEQAVEHYNQCLIIMKEVGARAEEGKAYGNLGSAYGGLGNFEQAVEYHNQCLIIAKEVGNTAEEGRAYGNLGKAYDSLGNFEQAVEYHNQCLITAKEMGDRAKEGGAYGNLGSAYCSLGNFEQAVEYHNQCLIIAKEVGDRAKEGRAYGNLGNTYHSLGNFEQAVEYHNQCLIIAKEVGDRAEEGRAYANLGKAYDSLGNFEQAVEYYNQQLSIVREVGDRAGEGRACGNLGNAYYNTDSSVPLEILARGSKAVYAFQKAMQTGKVKVYRGRIMLLGQDRAGKTSLKKSLLGLPFDPWQESTVGVQVDPSTCEIEVDQVINWTPSEQKKLEDSEFGEEIARLIVKDLAQTEADKKNETAAVSQLDQVQESGLEEEVKCQQNVEPPSNEAESWSYMDQKSEMAEEVGKSKDEGPVEKNNELELNIDTATLPNNVADLVVRYLQDLRLEDDIKTKEVILTLWDFAGQHLYYAAHSVFLSERAVYVLVYNLSKNLLAEGKPCCRQGLNDILLDNFNHESNLDNLLSWLVSVHCIRSVAVDARKNLANEKKKLPYLRPPVIIVGTHADQPFEDVKTTEKRIKKIISEQEYGGHVTAPFFAVNNKAENDEGVQKLRQRIMEVLKSEPYIGEEVPLRWFHFEKVVEALVAKSMYHVNLDWLLRVIKQLCHIDDEDETTAMLNFYHDLGVIVKHERTVVLQAQWLIDLFKQLITVPPFDEAVPLYRKYWKELQDTGILKTALVDHVFSDFVEKGLRKQDILEMMELYGLIAKFSSGMSTSENEKEQIYFVPTQLTSSPSELCEIKPSERDPCPLFVDFLDGFVPHGLFPQFVSRCISWCSENGFKETPKLFNNGASFSLGKQIIFALICRKRFIKVVLKRLPGSNKMAIKVRTFIEGTLNGLSQDLSWLSSLRYQLSVACTHCLQSDQDNSLVLLQVIPCGELTSCPKNSSHSRVTVPGLEKWFELEHSQNEEQEMDKSSEAEALDPSFPYKSGTPSRDDVLLIAHELGTKWKMLGRVLDVSDSVLEQIEKDNDERSESCYQVLIRWQERFASKATYQRLAQALQHPSVDRAALAVKYCEKKAG